MYPKKKLFSDYKDGEDDEKSILKSWSWKRTKNRNAIFFLEKGICKEIYVTCDDYNNFVEAKNRIKGDCETISPRNTNKDIENNYKCSIKTVCEFNVCSRVNKECRDFTDEETCNTFSPEDSNQKCIFKSWEC